MDLQELRKQKLFEAKRIKLLRETILDANANGMTYRELEGVLGESAQSLNTFTNKKANYSYKKCEILLAKCGI